MKQLELLVAVNPNAAFGKNATVGDRVKNALEAAGHSVKLLRESSYRLLQDSVAAELAEDRPDGLIVVGGDGMGHFGANMTAQTGIPFGIVPAGTGNDLARLFEIPLNDPAAACDWLLAALQREPQAIDALSISRGGERIAWAVSSLSGGFDAIVNERANLMSWPKGRSRYTISLLVELLKLKPLKYTVSVDGGPDREIQAVLIAVANNTQFGGGMKIVPTALIDDGELDLFIVKPLSRLAFLRIYPKVFKGAHVSDPRVEIQRAKRVTLAADGVTAYADGERISQLPLEVEVVPGALRFFA